MPIRMGLPSSFVIVPVSSVLVRRILAGLLRGTILRTGKVAHLALQIFALKRQTIFRIVSGNYNVPGRQLGALFANAALARSASSNNGRNVNVKLSIYTTVVGTRNNRVGTRDAPNRNAAVQF